MYLLIRIYMNKRSNILFLSPLCITVWKKKILIFPIDFYRKIITVYYTFMGKLLYPIHGTSNKLSAAVIAQLVVRFLNTFRWCFCNNEKLFLSYYVLVSYIIISYVFSHRGRCKIIQRFVVVLKVLENNVQLNIIIFRHKQLFRRISFV